MNCGACGRENPADHSFCGGCGARLSSLCSGCGHNNPPENAFCGGCGNALGAPAAAAPSAVAPAADPSVAPLPETFAKGRYRVAHFLGEGSRKRVYLARDERLEREVAVAQIKTDGLDANGTERVHREAQAMAKLGDHPNVVTVYDIVDAPEDGEGLLLISQYMSGGDLEAHLDAAQDRRLPIAESVTIAEQICGALEHAHSRGVIHRDLKPGNVWLAADGTAKLGDFGLAVSLDRSRMTQEGMMVGTVAYMAPEQALGRAPDARSDLYALGAMLYELLTGKPPFLGEDSVAIVSQHINTRPVAPSWHVDAVPRPLEDLTLRLLEKNPDDRPHDASEVARMLLAIETAVSSSTHGAPVPDVNPLDRLASGVFVGRDEEVQQLREGLDVALAGRGRLAMLVGEPGIGKTRTSEELTTYARMRGSQVLWGRCYEGEGAPPYWPWVQIIRSHVQESDHEELRNELGSGASVIAEVVSDIRDAFPELPTPAQLEGDEARFRLFDGVANFLRNAARRRPIVLVLDDLHWADKSSLLLLQFLAREIGRSPIFVLGTYRDVDLRRQHPLSAALAELSRGEGFSRVLLRGLQESDVARFIELSAGSAPQPGLAASVFRETEGNPFFVHEVVRLLTRDGRLDAARTGDSWSFNIPQGVREVIGQRLDHLSEGCNELLRVASALGREFQADVLEHVVDAPADEVKRGIEEALAARVLEPRDKPGRFAYSHALIRETLYEEIPTTRRVGLHRQIGQVLETSYAESSDSHLSELAYHFCEAAPGGDVSKAVDYAERAARRAQEQVAHEAAAANFERALQVLDLLQPPDERRRLALLLELASSLSAAGDPDRVASTCVRAIDLARSLGEVESLGEAVDLWSLPRWRYGVSDPELLERVEEALSLLPPENRALRARLSARTIMSLAFEDEERAVAVLRETEGLAREAGDAEAIAITLFMGSLLRTKSIAQGAREIDEYLANAPSGNRSTVNLRLLRWHMRMTMGEWSEAEAELAENEAVFERTRRADVAWFNALCRTALAIAAGRFEEGEKLAQEAFAKGQGAAADNASQYLLGHLVLLRLYQGRAEEIGGIAQSEVERMPDAPLIRAASADFAVALGQHELARAEVQYFADDDFAKIPAHIDRTYVIALIAQAASAVGELELLPRLYDMLLAEEAVIVGFGMAAGYVAPVSYYLATIDVALSRFDAAEQHLEAGEALCSRIGMRWALPRIGLLHAQMLERRDRPGDRAIALERCNAALALANRMGMKHVTDRALALKLRLQGTDASSTGGTIHAVSDAVQDQRPDIVKHAAPDGTVTLMFSDMEGFTVMTERLGDLKAREVIRDHNRIVREQLAQHRGYEVELQGDGFLLAFQSARQALLCGIAIQRRFAEYNTAHPHEPIRVRIGLHSGEALRDADKFFGRTVIMAARIAAQATGGQILVSELLKQLTASAGDLYFDAAREVELKGIAEPQRLCELRWND